MSPLHTHGTLRSNTALMVFFIEGSSSLGDKANSQLSNCSFVGVQCDLDERKRYIKPDFFEWKYSLVLWLATWLHESPLDSRKK